MKFIIPYLLLFFYFTAPAQTFKITGQMTDSTDNSTLIGVNIVLVSFRDSTNFRGVVTDVNGNFVMDNVTPGGYKIKATYIGYEPYERRIRVNTDVSLGKIKMHQAKTLLKDVVIEEKEVKVKQIEDTTQFNAGSYKTNPDANAEDLISKMPGVTNEGGTVKVKGEDVKQVFVDGKPFFGDDPNLALKNLPAEVIDKIQFFDKLSEQAQFTGFDDGQSQKAINIITKSGKNNGEFGKIYAGYGLDNRYITGGNINLFKVNRRISILALSNNINQQNFSPEDVQSATGTSGEQSRGGFGGGSMGRGGSSSGGASRGGRGGGGTDNFMVGQQGGITNTNALGVNYSNNFGEKFKMSGSYFSNLSNNSNSTDLLRTYISSKDSGQKYKEQNQTNSKSMNHRFNLRLDYNPDSSNSVTFTPKFVIQQSDAEKKLSGISYRQEHDTLIRTLNGNSSENQSYSYSGNLLLRHKFNKKGRTISLDAGNEFSNKTSDGKLSSVNDYSYLNSIDSIEQKNGQSTKGFTVSSNLSYTEPVGKSGQLLFSYNPSFNKNSTDKQTFNSDSLTKEYTVIDTPLTNVFENTYLYNKAGLSYQLSGKMLNLTATLNYQSAVLESKQSFPTAFSGKRIFADFLPVVSARFRFSQNKNMRIHYRTSTSPPSISQLQQVVDNSNSLYLSTGNPDLKQSFTNFFIFRFNTANTEKSTSFFIFTMLSLTDNYIGNGTYIPLSDSLLDDGTIVKKGVQLVKPVNLNNYRSARSFLTYSFPIRFIKSNLTFNTGFTYSKTPALINNKYNLADNYSANQGVAVNSNISEKTDFTLSYSVNFNTVKNTLQTQLNNEYSYQTASAKLNWIFWKELFLNTSMNYTVYNGTDASYEQKFLLWNTALGYKFMKNKALELKAGVYDILNQNSSINRTVTETYIEDSEVQSLKRFYLLTLTYNLKNFKTFLPPPSQNMPQPEHNRN